MGGACDLLPIPRAETSHIQSTPDPPFPRHHGQETCRSGLAGLSTTLKLTGASTTQTQVSTRKNEVLCRRSKFPLYVEKDNITYRATWTSSKRKKKEKKILTEK